MCVGNLRDEKCLDLALPRIKQRARFDGGFRDCGHNTGRDSDDTARDTIPRDLGNAPTTSDAIASSIAYSHVMQALSRRLFALMRVNLPWMDSQP